MLTSSLSFFVGFRFIRKRYCHSMVSVISTISTLGIILSVAIQIIGLSAINGFEKELKSRILAVIAHGEIEPLKQPWKNWSQALKMVKTVEGVNAVSPYVNFTGLIENGVNLCVVQIRGIDPLQERQLTVLPKFVQNSAWEHFSQGKRQIILGKGIADLLQVKVGDWISIMIPNSRSNHIQQFKNVRVQISGIFHSNSQIDHNLAIVPIKDACSYLEIDDSITGISFKANDIFNAKDIACKVGEILNKEAYIKSWVDTYGYVYHDIQMIRAIVNLTMFLIIGIAYFNIVATLIIVVKDKNSDIAIFRTLGANDSFIRAVFMWYGFLTGAKGSLFGALIGIVVSLNLTKIVQSIEKLINHQLLSSNIYFINFIPSKVDWLDAGYVIVVALLLSLLASWYPSYCTNRINPAKELNRQ